MNPMFSALTVAAIATISPVCIPPAEASACESSGPDHYLCGIPSAEDLVRIPGTPWLLASDISGASVLNLIDTRHKTWAVLYPSAAAQASPDRDRYTDCPGPAPAPGLTTHGLHIVPGEAGRSTLYAVSHGSREAIEVFEITVVQAAERPSVTWVGCVPTPQAQEVNSVTALADGSLLATIPIEHGSNFSAAMAGEATGAVYRWNRADGLWRRLDETAMPYANGIEVAADGSAFFVASSGLQRIFAYSNTVPARLLGSSDVLSIIPDNLHRDEQGEMVTAGLMLDYPACEPHNEAGEFELARFASCPRPWEAMKMDPITFEMSTIATGDVNPTFSNITMAVDVDGVLWVGTFAGDRVAYRKLD